MTNGKRDERMRDGNKPRRSERASERDDEAQPKHDRRCAERKHDERVEKFFEAGWFGKRIRGGITKRKRKENCHAGISKRVARGLNWRDIKQRSASIDEKFLVVIGCESILNFAALTTVRFEAGEGADGEGG